MADENGGHIWKTDPYAQGKKSHCEKCYLYYQYFFGPDDKCPESDPYGPSKQPRLPAKKRIESALAILEDASDISGDHHKQWLIDQVVRELLGNEDRYKKWVRHNNWDEGTAP
jgi:hypothetical protein